MGLKVGWGRASGNHQGGANSKSLVDGVLDTMSACRLCGSLGEASEKEQWPLTTPVWEKAGLPAPALVLHNSLLPVCL